MASQGSDSRDKFDMTQSTETWASFLGLAKWVIVSSLIALVIMAMFLTGSNPAP